MERLFSRYCDLQNSSPSHHREKSVSVSTKKSSSSKRVSGRATVTEKLLRALNRKSSSSSNCQPKDSFCSVSSPSRKAILANELSNYDLFRQRYQGDLDDDLSDNVLEKFPSAHHHQTSSPFGYDYSSEHERNLQAVMANGSGGTPSSRKVNGRATVNDRLLRNLNKGSRDQFCSVSTPRRPTLAKELSAYEMVTQRYQCELDDDPRMPQGVHNGLPPNSFGDWEPTNISTTVATFDRHQQQGHSKQQAAMMTNGAGVAGGAGYIYSKRGGGAAGVSGRSTVNEKLLRALNRSPKDAFCSVSSRKSILANELSAYDLIKQHNDENVAAAAELGDDLSDNVLETLAKSPGWDYSCDQQNLQSALKANAINSRRAKQTNATPTTTSGASAGGTPAMKTATAFNNGSRSHTFTAGGAPVGASVSTNEPQSATKANDLLSNNLRIGGQGMVLFSWDKQHQQQQQQQQQQNQVETPNATATSTRSCGRNSSRMHKEHQASGSNIRDSSGEPPIETHYTVPEPDYDLSDDESGSCLGHPSLLYHCSPTSQLPTINTTVKSYRPVSGSSAGAAPGADNGTRCGAATELAKANHPPAPAEEKETAYNHIKELKLKSPVAAKSILKKPSETSSYQQQQNNNDSNASSTDSISSLSTNSIAKLKKEVRIAQQPVATVAASAAAGPGTVAVVASPASSPASASAKPELLSSGIRPMSKLKQHKRARKYVTFRSYGDELEHINEPIPEEDEPLYDDIYTGGSLDSSSSSSTEVDATVDTTSSVPLTTTVPVAPQQQHDKDDVEAKQEQAKAPAAVPQDRQVLGEDQLRSNRMRMASPRGLGAPAYAAQSDSNYNKRLEQQEVEEGRRPVVAGARAGVPGMVAQPEPAARTATAPRSPFKVAAAAAEAGSTSAPSSARNLNLAAGKNLAVAAADALEASSSNSRSKANGQQRQQQLSGLSGSAQYGSETQLAQKEWRKESQRSKLSLQHRQHQLRRSFFGGSDEDGNSIAENSGDYAAEECDASVVERAQETFTTVSIPASKLKINDTNAYRISHTELLLDSSLSSSNYSSASYESSCPSSSGSLAGNYSDRQPQHHHHHLPLTGDIVKYTTNKIVIDVPLGNVYEAISSPESPESPESLESPEHIYEEVGNINVNYSSSGSPLAASSGLDPSKKSIFEGASKDEILEYLEDAKERVEVLINCDPRSGMLDNGAPTLLLPSGGKTSSSGAGILASSSLVPVTESAQSLIESTISISSSQHQNRRNRTSNVSNSSTDSAMTTASTSSSLETETSDESKSSSSAKLGGLGLSSSLSQLQLVERNDSGVGTETSKPSKLRRSASATIGEAAERQCTDCEQSVEPTEEDATGLLFYPLTCGKCEKKRTERKEIIGEFVDTEFKYGRDLRIVREEFLRPMEVAGLLSKDQLKSIFLNLDELIRVNVKFAERLKDALDIATEQGDEDLTTVNIGKLFMDSSAMLHAYETYCIRQGPASLLLTHLEKEKELLRIFLRVSQMENTLLRRMNLSAFLMVPVQRVTKYPLLLNRLYRVTPYHHRDREALRAVQQKVELHLEHINQQTKSTPTKIWRRISNLSSHQRRLPNVDDIGNIKLRKAAMDSLKWNREEVQFILSGKLLFTPLTECQTNKKGGRTMKRTIKFLSASALLVTLGKPTESYRPDLVSNSESGDKQLTFPRGNTGITDAALLLMKEKSGRFVLHREPLYLQSCVVSSEADANDLFEIHEHMGKESYLFKAEAPEDTRAWFGQLCYHSKDLGNWRKRRNALANIMMTRPN